MLLAIDVGNTNTVIGVFDAEAPDLPPAGRAAGELAGLRHHWRVATVPERTADELALVISQLLSLDGLALPMRGGTPGVLRHAPCSTPARASAIASTTTSGIDPATRSPCSTCW